MRTALAAIVLLGAAGAASAQTYTIKTFAGGGLPENVAAPSASLGAVTGIAVDKSGALFVSLADYQVVLRLNPATGILERVTTEPFGAPLGLAVDASGRLYVADAGSFRVRSFANGSAADVAGNGTQGYGGDGGSAAASRFDTPFAVAIDAAGALYVADFYNNVVRKVEGNLVMTIAGNGEYGAGPDGPATASPLGGPSGIALDAAGNLYIAELYNNRIRKVSNGTITTIAGTGTAGFTGDKGQALAATLRQPSDVAIDAAGNVYVADYGNNRIRMIAPGGVITTLAGNGTLNATGDGAAAASAGLAAPRRVALDSAGNLYIADGVRVRKIVKNVISTVAGGGAPAGEGGPAAAAQIMTPQGLAIDPSGNVYISDSGTARVLKVAGGILTRVAGTGNPATTIAESGPANTTALNAPAGLAFDSTGAVYVADAGAARVRKVANGTTTTFAGSGATFGDNGPANKAQLTAPDGLAIGGDGALYVSDGHRVRAVVDGVIKTFAGNGSVGYQGDGALATAARLASPAGLAVDSAGSLVIADTGNNRVRTVSGGIISTVAGAAALNGPVAVAADAAGDVYVAEQWRVLKISKGKITSLAGVDGPQGIAVDASGNVYVGDPVNHRVLILSPAGTSCAATVSAPASTYPAAGAAVALTLQTGAGCPWTVDGLPSWISLSGSSYGVGPATVNLAVQANTDVPRSAALTIGGQPITISQTGFSTLTGVVTLSTTGKPLPGVTIAVTGATTATLTTDAGGNYILPNLPSTGPYVITPSLPGYGFVAASTTMATLSATPVANFVAWPRPNVAALTPSAYAPGQIVTIYGAGLCGPAAAANPTLPDRLGSCMVRVDNTAIRLYYASPNQINAVLPQTLSAGPHQMIVQRYTTTAYNQLAAASEPLPFTVAAIAPSIFAVGQTGDIVTVYLTGLGRKSQTFSEGAAPGRTANAVEQIRATVAGQAATVLYSGVQPQYPGLDQINLRVPASTRPAALEITAVSTGEVVRYTLPPL